MQGINIELLAGQLSRLRGDDQRGGVGVDVGQYVTRLVSLKQDVDRSNRLRTLATFEVVGGSSTSQRIETPVWGHAERVLSNPANRGSLYEVLVYVHRLDDGREYRRVNIEGIRLLESAVIETPAAPIEMPDIAAVTAAASGFVFCFERVGSAGGRRRIVTWRDRFDAMARCADGAPVGEVVFFSTFNFTTALADHQAKNDRDDQSQGRSPRGSLEGFAGECYSPLVVFDTDCRDAEGNADPASCQNAATMLVAVLMELGVEPSDIHVFYSGAKGFHVAIPTALAAAMPGGAFHLVTKEFCRLVASRAGVLIDESVYRTVQPFRAPNSRHEKTGLYKVRLTLDELIELPFDEIREIARQPRVFEPPACIHEPSPPLVELWRQAEHSVRNAAKLECHHGTNKDATITRATWDYLLNGAEVGTRAEAHFKAAANLADFGSVDKLVRALMQRPAQLSGLPAREAEGHVENALRRAATRTNQESSPTEG